MKKDELIDAINGISLNYEMKNRILNNCNRKEYKVQHQVILRRIAISTCCVMLIFGIAILSYAFSRGFITINLPSN